MEKVRGKNVRDWREKVKGEKGKDIVIAHAAVSVPHMGWAGSFCLFTLALFCTVHSTLRDIQFF
jgi:hypothetical protein